MKLTDKQRKIVEKEFEENWKNKKCPFCEGKEWAFSDKIFEIREFQEGSLILGGDSSILPIIVFICEKCSHAVFLSAIKLGLLNNGNKNESKKE